jgi:hypothetical protein
VTARFGLVLLTLVALCAGDAALAEDPVPVRTYAVLYDVRIAPTERAAEVVVRLTDPDNWMRRIRFHIDRERQVDWKGDGQIVAEGDTVSWIPPKLGGTLRYTFRIDALRDSRSFDARCSENWAIFRGDDLVPPASVLTEDHAQSRTRMRLRLPKDWSAVVPWRAAADGSYAIENPDRKFDRPVGWVAAGRLAVTRETVAGVKLALVGPVGQRVPRLDRLALLRWTLPELRDVLGDTLPERISVLGAGDPMWRGGLSGPRSLFLHSSRPLIENDGTSPLLHELMHAALRISGGERGDWIVEGVAELYSLELLRRSKTLSRSRYERSLARLAERGSRAPTLEVPKASGDVTARAVTVLHALDAEIRLVSNNAANLDGVVARLAEERKPVDAQRLRELAETVAGASLERFFARTAPAALQPRPEPPKPAPKPAAR